MTEPEGQSQPSDTGMPSHMDPSVGYSNFAMFGRRSVSRTMMGIHSAPQMPALLIVTLKNG